MRFLPASARFRFAVGCVLIAAISAPAAAQAKGRRGSRPSAAAQDQQRRRQAAAELRKQGLDVDWRLASWAELHGWTLRVAEARALRDHTGVVVDWRTCALAEMRDWEGRIARAVDLRRFGVDADWRLLTSRQLDDLRLVLDRPHAGVPQAPPTAYELVPRPQTVTRFDPDAILLPTYVVEGLSNYDADDGVLEANYSLPVPKLRRVDLEAASGEKSAPAAGPATVGKPGAAGTIGQKKKKSGSRYRAFRSRADI